MKVISDFTVLVGEKEFELPRLLYPSFALMGDVDNVYSGGAIAIQDDNGQLLSSGTMSVGAQVIFRYFSKELEAKSDKPNDVVYRVLSIESEIENIGHPATAGGLYIYNLINAAFFDQIIASRGYHQKMSDIISAEVKQISTKGFKSFNIKSTDDLKSRRFMINERPLTFVKNISKKTTINGGPTLCYTDELGNFNLVGITDLIDQSPVASLVPINSPVNSSYEKIVYNGISPQLFKDIDNFNMIKLKATLLDIETNLEKSDIYTNYFNIKGGTSVLFDSNVINQMVYTDQRTFLDEGNAEQKALMQQLRLVSMKNFEISIEAHNALGVISAGNLVELCVSDPMLKNQAQNTSYSGIYLVKRCEHRYIKGMIRSKLNLIKPTTIVNSTMINKNLVQSKVTGQISSIREL